MSRNDLVGDYEIKQGATWVVTFLYVDSTGAIISLVGYTARMQGRANYEATSTLFSLTTGGSGLTIDGAAGSVTATLTAAQTTALTAGQFVYDLEIIDGSGVVTRMSEGVGVISREATR